MKRFRTLTLLAALDGDARRRRPLERSKAALPKLVGTVGPGFTIS